MRGYISFLLVLAALAILIVLANSYNNSKSVNFSKAIALERMEQLSLDAKRSMLTAAKYGAIAGFLEYLAELAATGGAKAFDPQKAKERVQEGVIASLALIGFSQEPDYEISLWCGEISGESELDEIAGRSLRNGAPQMCASCKPLSLCKDFVDVEIIAGIQNADFAIANLGLGSRNLGGNPKIFGATIYSEKFNVSKVSYIPTSEKIFEIPYPAPPGVIK